MSSPSSVTGNAAGGYIGPVVHFLSADAVSTNGLGVTVKVPSLTVVTDKLDNTVPPEIVMAAEPTSALAADNVG